jgi:hypothetical protein
MQDTRGAFGSAGFFVRGGFEDFSAAGFFTALGLRCFLAAVSVVCSVFVVMIVVS